MTTSIQGIFKKISYIEAEVEIQKQILHSIPTNDTEQIEKVLKTIAAAKKEIFNLRSEIKKIDPEEYGKLTRIEDSVTEFKKINSEKKFSTIQSITYDEKCSLACRDGREIQCLIKACDENGDWTIITTDGYLINLSNNDVSVDL